MASGNPNYYSNPAFCQQSEFYHQGCVSPRQRALSPERRQPPVGAHKPVHQEVYRQQRNGETPPKLGPKPKIVQRNNSIQIKIGPVNDNEPEEVLAEDPRLYQESQKYLDVSNGNTKQITTRYNNGNEEYQEITNRPIVKPTSNKGRYAVVTVDDETEDNHRSVKHRYEYIPMQEQANGYPSSPRKQMPHAAMHQEEVEVVQGRVHRYAVIPPDEEELTTKKNRYALVPVSELKPNSRYAVVPSEEINRNSRYDYIPDEVDNQRYYQEATQYVARRNYVHQSPNKSVTSPQTPKKGNPIATQKLHELLSTPKKVRRSSSSAQTPFKILSPQSQRRIASPQATDPFFTPNKSPPKIISPRHQTPKAQQKLNYTLSTRQQINDNNKRHTAVIAPICSSPVQSVYSETTFSNKTGSWMNLSMQKPPVQATLAVAAVMMVLCGGLTAGLCFYMVSVVGRMYYLDFGTVSGFACLLLGLLGFRSRNCQWLPNRNYISGYIVLSAFSLLTCAGLLVLLALQPKPGSPLADVTSGAVCGISGLSLIMASAGVIASYCCKYPPPDNRVQHCAQGFTV